MVRDGARRVNGGRPSYCETSGRDAESVDLPPTNRALPKNHPQRRTGMAQ